jgi:hypothetical protein
MVRRTKEKSAGSNISCLSRPLMQSLFTTKRFSRRSSTTIIIILLVANGTWQKITRIMSIVALPFMKWALQRATSHLILEFYSASYITGEGSPASAQRQHTADPSQTPKFMGYSIKDAEINGL